MSRLRVASMSRRGLLLALSGLAGVLAAACAPASTPTGAPKAPTTAPTATAVPATAPAAKPTEAPKPAQPTKPSAQPAAQPSAAGKQGIEFEVATRIGTDAEVMPKTVERFNQQTGHKGKFAGYPTDPEYQAKVMALHATKQVADVIWASVFYLHWLASKGVLAELEPLIQADKYNTEDYVKASLDTLKLNGKLYGLPWGAHHGQGSVLYNVDLLSKGGLNVTDDCASFDNLTWDQLVETGKKVTQGDTYGFMPSTDFVGTTNYVGSFGGEFLSADGKQLTMDTAEFKRGLQLMADIFAAHKIAPMPDPKLNTGELFAGGKLAMLHTGYWGQFSPGPKAIADRFKWNLGLTPKGPAGKRGTTLTINGQTIWSGSEKKDVAWQFLKFLMEPEQNVEIVLSGGGRPALRKAVLYNDRLMKEMKAHKCQVPALEAAEPWKQPANLRFSEFDTTVKQVFADLWLGKVNVDKAIADAKPKLQAVLDKPVP